VSTVYPARLEGRLEEGLSRWLWLVKWILLIPHYVALVFLFVAALGATLVAFFVILFTGRYPRGMFDFTVGVLRWAWRVGFYGYSALGTDRYPPFSLAPHEDYPATLEVDYPERLSQGKVLVKWLLVIPHLLVIGVFVGTSPSLVAILVLIAAVGLLFTGRYVDGVFPFVVGLDRWVLRATSYLLLLTDEYPPFRLDQGDTEPAAETGVVR
jgi:hypothetical protein